MSVIVLHLFAGAVAGTMFTVRTLLVMSAIIFVECIVAAIALGLAAGLCSVVGLVAVQIGYLAGLYLRGVPERAGIAQPSIRHHHPRLTAAAPSFGKGALRAGRRPR